MVLVLVSLLGCSTKVDYSGHWNYQATLDDGTVLEGETDAVQNADGFIFIKGYRGKLQNEQITIEVNESHEQVKQQVSGWIRPQSSDPARLKGQLQIKEIHPDGEVVNTRVDLQAWR